MADEELEELKLLIPGYTPDTMPLPKLLEYLTQIAAVMGEELSNEMHLVRVVKSSTKPVLKMRPQAAQRAREQAVSVRSGQGTVRQRAAYNRVREMVRRDGGKPARLADRTGVLIDFEPAAGEPEIIATVRQPTTFDGKLIRVGGQSDDSTVLLENLSGNIQSNFTAPRTLAKSMGAHLFEPIRVSGPGVWNRNRDGNWFLANMRIQAFEPLAEDDLAEVLKKLRDTKVSWPHNADEIMQADRESAL